MYLINNDHAILRHLVGLSSFIASINEQIYIQLFPGKNRYFYAILKAANTLCKGMPSLAAS